VLTTPTFAVDRHRLQHAQIKSGDGSAKPSHGKLRAGVGIEGKDGVVRGGDTKDVVDTAGDGDRGAIRSRAFDLAIHLHHELLVEQIGAQFYIGWPKNGFGCVCAGAKLVVAPLLHVKRAKRKGRAGDD
jgi:hypothetical protein